MRVYRIYPLSIAAMKMTGASLPILVLTAPFLNASMPGGKQQWLKELRDREVLRLFTAQGKGVKDLAFMFGVSRRTIQRILKRAKE
jgi:hypothetical protein